MHRGAFVVPCCILRRLEKRKQHVDVDRLDQVGHESGLGRSRAVRGLAVTGDGDELRAGWVGIAELTSKLVTVHSGQADVHEDDAGPKLAGSEQSRRTVARANCMEAVKAQ